MSYAYAITFESTIEGVCLSREAIPRVLEKLRENISYEAGANGQDASVIAEITATINKDIDNSKVELAKLLEQFDDEHLVDNDHQLSGYFWLTIVEITE
jgi:hypothetical protein